MTSLVPKVFPEAVDALCYSWCPTMDLVAITVGNGKRVLIFRMNGTKVWDIPINQGIVKDLVWRPDGKQLAITLTKSQTLVYDTNTARLLSTLSTTQDANFGHWIVSDAPPTNNKFAGIIDSDVMKSLPRLPPLPSSSKTAHTFATREAIDVIQHEKNNMMDLLFLFGDKDVTITLHGLFLLGSVNIIPQDSDDDIVNAATRTVEDHYVLTSSFTTMQHTLRRFSTQFVQSYDFLQDITLSSSKIIALLGYIEEILIFSTQAIKAYTEFNTKFVGILKEELTNKNEVVVDELYNLLLTGMMNDEVKDWIQNTVGDRGVKRWSKIGETAFESTRRTILYHLVPACERLILLLSKLNSMSKSSVTLSEKFELEHLNNSSQAVKKLLKLLFDFVFKINREQELFNSFIIWIHSTLSELQDEIPKEKYVTSEVSTFINDHLEKSVLMMLVPYLRRNFNEVKIHTHDMFESIKSHIRSSITPDNSFAIPLGRCTEKQAMKFIDGELYVVSYYETTLDIYKVDVTSQNTRSTSVVFPNEIKDVQLTEDAQVFITIESSLLRIDTSPLFINSDLISQKLQHTDIATISHDEVSGLNVKHITINGARNIGCAISEDLLRYTIFFLHEED